MAENPTYEELKKKVAELEQQVDQNNSAAKTNPPELFSVLMEAFQYIPRCKTFEDAAKAISLQRKLYILTMFTLPSLSVRKIGFVVSILYPNHLLDQVFHGLFFHWQQQLDQKSKLRQCNGWCFFSPS